LRLNNVKGNTGYFCGGKIKGRKLFTDDSHEKKPYVIYYAGTKP